MALSEARNWLIAYDIASPVRLRRVHRLLCEHAVPVQYSVFATRGTPMKIGDIRKALAQIIDVAEDDVRIYPVPEPPDLVVFGRKALPYGLYVLDGSSALELAPLDKTSAREL